MKKSLIALAVLGAFAGAASAQSSVTLYGNLDITIGKVSGGKWGLNNGEGYTLPATGNINAAAKDGYNSTSVFGLKGSEDLGGGLRANFDLQSGGLDLSTGATALAFSREAWVGLQGGFGEIRLGRSSSIAAKGLGGFDINGTSYSSALDRAGISPVTWYASSRRSDQIQYASPNLGGVVVRVGYTAAGDNVGSDPTAPAAGGNGIARYSGAVNYNAGPLALGVVAETQSNDNTTATTAKTKLRTATGFAASYDFAVVKIGAGYVESPRTYTGLKNINFFAYPDNPEGGKGYFVNAVAPVGAFTLGVQYAKNSETDGQALELFAKYALSKRTRLYVDYVQTKNQDAITATANAVTGNPASTAATAAAAGFSAIPKDPKNIALGVVHSF